MPNDLTTTENQCPDDVTGRLGYWSMRTPGFSTQFGSTAHLAARREIAEEPTSQIIQQPQDEAESGSLRKAFTA